MEIIIKEISVKSVMTKSNLPAGDFSVNPYTGCTHGCRYCYASFMKRFTNHPEPWGDFLDVKCWPEIKNPQRYAGKDIFMGSVTDPYLPQEAVYRRTRMILEQLQGSGARLTIQTKSDLVLRDLELIKTFPKARVGFSINTLDETFKAQMDRAVSIRRRLEAMRRLHEAGVRTTCFISPIFPCLTDVPAIVERVKEQFQLIWLENLNLRGSFKADVLKYINEHHAELRPLYEEIYLRGRRRYWQELDAQMRRCAEGHGLAYLYNDDTAECGFSDPPIMVNYFYHEEIKKSAVRL